MEKKKVVFINNHFQKSDGTVRALINLCNSLDQEKFDITIVPLYRYEADVAKELDDGIKVKPCFGHYFKGLSRILHLLPIKFLHSLFIGDEFDIEIAFQCDIPTKLVGYRRFKNKVQVAWMHGYENYPEYYCNLDKVICVSKYNADRCISELPYKADVEFCYNLIFDKAVQELGHEDVCIPEGNGPLFVTVGRLSPEKGYLRLIEIVHKLKQEGHNCRLMIVGGGSEENSLKSKIVELGMEDSIFLMGKHSNPHKFTSKADLFICSSYSEGYSTACVEAAILGIPIVTTRVPGAEEIIDDCGCGCVCDDTNDESLYFALRDVLMSPHVIDEWKEKMKESRFQFSFENRIKRVRALFNELYDLSNEKKAL